MSDVDHESKNNKLESDILKSIQSLRLSRTDWVVAVVLGVLLTFTSISIPLAVFSGKLVMFDFDGLRIQK